MTLEIDALHTDYVDTTLCLYAWDYMCASAYIAYHIHAACLITGGKGGTGLTDVGTKNPEKRLKRE